MSKFNPIERYLANSLSKFPNFKNKIKELYSSGNYYIYKKGYNCKTDLKTKKILSDVKNESFFGYYDKSPLSSDGRYIIFHETEGIISHFPPDPDKPVNIVIYNTEKPKYKKIASTTAYNWQQGSKLQWLHENKFIFNDYENENYVSKMFDIPNNSFTTIDYPIYDCFKDKFALSLNFSRLNKLDSHYGYKNISGTYLADVKNDGIFYIDLKTGKNRLLISIDQVISLHPKETMINAKHCFNHIMISPDGENFIFIHRWYQSGKRFDSLILSNIEGTAIKVLADNGMVSHCCWYNNESVVGYLNHTSYSNSFYKINTPTGNIELLSERLKSFGDGHPSFHGNKMLFDSYPDRSRMQHLYLCDDDKKEMGELGTFLTPLKFYGETRSDLHPRWSSDGKNIFFDSTHEGNRCLYTLNLTYKGNINEVEN